MRACLAAVLALAACTGPKPAPAVEFLDHCRVLACARIGDTGGLLAVAYDGDDLVFDATHLPRGSKIAVGDRTAASQVRIPIGNVLHKLTIRQVIGADEIDFGLKLTVRLDGTKPVTVPVPPLKLGRQLIRRLATVTRGPVLFANEAGPPPRHTAVLAEQADHIVFGPAKLMEDIDWIAIRKKYPAHVLGTCNGQTVTGEPETLMIYERRTGKLLETKDFPVPMPTCPSASTVALDPNVMKAWLAERVEQP